VGLPFEIKVSYSLQRLFCGQGELKRRANGSYLFVYFLKVDHKSKVQLSHIIKLMTVVDI